MQRIDLPSEFLSQTLTNVRVSDTGAVGLQRIHVVGVTVDAEGTTLPGSIQGQKFEDVNGNGRHDADEPGLNGWTVELVDAATGQVVDSQGHAFDGSERRCCDRSTNRARPVPVRGRIAGHVPHPRSSAGGLGAEFSGHERRDDPLALTPLPTAWWTGDGGATDVMAGRNGELRGDATTTAGLIDEAFWLDGQGTLSMFRTIRPWMLERAISRSASGRISIRSRIPRSSSKSGFSPPAGAVTAGHLPR